VKVEFKRTGRRRYMIRTTVDGQAALIMDPGPGYDSIATHDLFHYVVERELGVDLGIFGQLAASGDAGTFYLGPTELSTEDRRRLARRIKARGEKLEAAGRADAREADPGGDRPRVHPTRRTRGVVVSAARRRNAHTRMVKT
jgi:hypothetical protein